MGSPSLAQDFVESHEVEEIFERRGVDAGAKEGRDVGLGGNGGGGRGEWEGMLMCVGGNVRDIRECASECVSECVKCVTDCVLKCVRVCHNSVLERMS